MEEKGDFETFSWNSWKLFRFVNWPVFASKSKDTYCLLIQIYIDSYWLHFYLITWNVGYISSFIRITISFKNIKSSLKSLYFQELNQKETTSSFLFSEDSNFKTNHNFIIFFSISNILPKILCETKTASGRLYAEFNLIKYVTSILWNSFWYRRVTYSQIFCFHWEDDEYDSIGHGRG